MYIIFLFSTYICDLRQWRICLWKYPKRKMHLDKSYIFSFIIFCLHPIVQIENFCMCLFMVKFLNIYSEITNIYTNLVFAGWKTQILPIQKIYSRTSFTTKVFISPFFLHKASKPLPSQFQIYINDKNAYIRQPYDIYFILFGACVMPQGFEVKIDLSQWCDSGQPTVLWGGIRRQILSNPSHFKYK